MVRAAQNTGAALVDIGATGAFPDCAIWRNLGVPRLLGPIASGVFETLTKPDFATLLRELGRRQFLMQDSGGLLLHGETGEKVANHYSFLASFISPEEFRVMCEGRFLGTLPVDRPLTPESFLIFAGRRWLVVECSEAEKLIQVVPARGGKLPLFDGMGGKVHDHVREEMRMVLSESESIAYLDPAAAAQLSEARGAYTQLALAARSIVAEGHTVRVFTWRGDWVNDTLALMLTANGLSGDQRRGFHRHTRQHSRDGIRCAPRYRRSTASNG